jgi:N4-gp56 family major capsid protein
MASNINTYGDINQRTAAYVATEMLSHAEPVLVLQKFGMSKPMPMNKAEKIVWRRPVPFPAATTPLKEGVTPPSRKMQYEDVEATMQEWGSLVEITNRVQDMAEDPVLKDASMLCGEQAGLTIEMVTYGVVKAGTSVYYTNGALRTSVNTPVNKNRLRQIIRGLKTLKAKKLSQVLSPSPNYGTRAIQAAYFAVGHTDLEQDIENMPGFTPVAEYASGRPASDLEVGSCSQARFVLSPELGPWADGGGAYAGAEGDMVTTSGTSADVYPLMFFGKEAFGCVPLKGKGSIAPKVLQPGVVRGGDPLGQRGSVGWITYYTAVILNQSWMSRMEAAVSDLS